MITVGVGRNIDENGGIGLSDDEIDYLLENDIKRCKQELIRYSWFSDLDSVRQDAMVNLCFNLGFSRLSLFTNALAAMAVADYDRAAMEFLDSKWARQVGRRSEDVAHMIRTGEYPS
jgi:lysozyme